MNGFDEPNIKATLCFLRRKSFDSEEVCLAMKKRGFGKGKLNGVGGKVEKSESVEEAIIRETKEEITVSLINLERVGELAFYFKENPDWNLIVHIFLSSNWNGEPTETEEMKPEWFLKEDIPYDKMWIDDKIWLPLALKGKEIDGYFYFKNQDELIEWELK